MSTIEAIKHTAQAAGKRERKWQAGNSISVLVTINVIFNSSIYFLFES